MISSKADNAKSWIWVLPREFAAWGKTEGLGWIFVLKTTIAALMALGISLRLELGQPVTAMITVYIIMHPQTGMVLTKSLYRVCGTFAGALASLTLLSLFPQERVLFLLGLSIWIGLCTAGAALYRNFKSYGFTLAGYTAAMISLPLVMQPTGFFNYAVNRVSEVVIGILCAAVVSEVVFPRSLSDSIVRTMQTRYADFIRFVQAMFSEGMKPQEIDSAQLRFISSVVNLESFRSSVIMEASDIRTHDLRLRRLNQDFMATSTTLHSLYQLLSRLKKADAPATEALVSLGESLTAVLVTNGEPALTAEEAHQTARRIAAFRATFPEQVDTIRNQYAAGFGNQANLDFETALELVSRFVRELDDYASTYASLVGERHSLKHLENMDFAACTDPVVALLTGARTMVVIMLTSAFWIASAWSNGASAVMMAAIVSALFAPAPDPALALKVGLVGALVGFIAALICKFFVLTSLDGFGLLCAGMVPFLLVGPYLTLNPKLSMIGLGYIMMFCFMISPSNMMQYDPAGSINFGSALILGVASASVIFATFAPVTGVWLKRRTARLLRHQVEMACIDPLPSITHRFESGTRDILQRLAAKQTVQDTYDKDMLDWMFIVLEIGRAIIHLRQDSESVSLPQPLLDSVKNTIQATASLFKRPNERRQIVTLGHVEYSIELVHQELIQEELGKKLREALRRILASLHLIRTSLLDEETILAATVAGPQATVQGEIRYAS
ncbi:MAG: FUSC family protein [Oryzomonas sp.]|uniref:FUSC family protein n=1 Tax=Oryzomonas sp. TaxID=2855186 RepID=UPI002842073E|nr:FUSC family protein [Oryzomonas sp.]MDR3581506.1 FUSC family protein [Oryzomonas sp.]